MSVDHFNSIFRFVREKEIEVGAPEVKENTSEGSAAEDESDDDDGPSMTKVFDEFGGSSTDEEDLLQEDEDVEDETKSEAERLAERKVKVDQYMLQIG